METTQSLLDVYDLVNEQESISLEMDDAHHDLDTILGMEDGIHHVMTLENSELEENIYEMFTLDSPEAYSAEGIKSAAIKTGSVLYKGGKATASGVKYIASKTIPIVKVASIRGWDLASKQYRTLTDTPESIEKTTKLMIEQCSTLRKLRATSKKSDVTYRLEGKSLAMTYITPNSQVDITNALSNVSRAIEATHKTWFQEIEKLGAGLVKVTSSYDKSNPDMTLIEMNKLYAKLDMAKSMSAYKADNLTDKRFKRHKTKAGEELPGSLRVFITTPLNVPKDFKDTDIAKLLRVNQIRTLRTTSKVYTTAVSTTMATMTLDEVEKCLEANLEALKTIYNYRKADIFDKLSKHGAYMQSNLDKIVFKQILEPRWIRTNNAIYMYLGHYMKCSTSPMSSLLASAFSAMRSNITICRRHLATYTK